ncbi:MAG: hypothetical protein KF891_09330 [Rhizobacter sp.]|nr:hypothetical protein [Rhizobacter sp.]
MNRKPAPSDAPQGPKPHSADDDESALESLGKAVVEPVLGSDRTTTGERVREKLPPDERPAPAQRGPREP